MSAQAESAGPGTEAPLLRIRVSRDSGRTWSQPRTYRAGEGAGLPPLTSGQWPPCACPRCRDPHG